MERNDRASATERRLLSEYEAKKILASYGVPVTKEILVSDREALASALEEIGYPVVLKGISAETGHKTEAGLVRLDVRNLEEATRAFDEIMAILGPSGDGVLAQEMIRGARELMVGLTSDPQFGPCVMFGLGGILTEALHDVTFRLAPLDKSDALEMMDEIRGSKILGALRGMPAVDRDLLADVIVAVGKIGVENEEIKEIDINPLVVRDAIPVAVDALFVMD